MNKTNAKQKKPQEPVREIKLKEMDLPFTPFRADGVTENVKAFLEVGAFLSIVKRRTLMCCAR